MSGYSDNAKGLTRVPDPLSDKKPPAMRFNSIGKMALWDTHSGRVTRNYLYAPANEESWSESIRFSADGKQLIGDGRPPALFDAFSGKRLHVLGSTRKTFFGYFNEKLGLVAIQNGPELGIEVVDVKTNRVVWKPNNTDVLRVEWCGSILAILDYGTEYGNARVLLWDGQTRQKLPTPNYAGDGSFSFHPDGRTISFFETKGVPDVDGAIFDLNAPTQYQVVRWDYRLHREVSRHDVSDMTIWGQEWSPDGKWLAMTTASETPNPQYSLKVFDISGNLKIEQKLGADVLAWSPDSTQIAAIAPKREGEKNNQIILVPIS